MPAVSVILPCFNYGRYLDEAVASVLEQSREDFEIVIVDDGSTDPLTRSLLDAYQRPKTTVLRTENRGPAAARNTGIRASTGRYVVCLDADDRLHCRYLEKTTAVLNADDERRLGFVTTWRRRFGDESFASDAGDGSPANLAIENHIHSGALFRRRVWESVGGYRESFTGWEDWNLWLNMVGAGYLWEIVPEELYYYRKHGESRSSRSLHNRLELFEAVMQDNAAFYRNHHQEILKAFFRKLGELESVWREKDLALSDNRTLSHRLEEERARHQQSLEDYRRLDDYCCSLLLSLGEAQEGQRNAEQEYRRLEAYCRSLKSALGLSQPPADPGSGEGPDGQ